MTQAVLTQEEIFQKFNNIEVDIETCRNNILSWQYMSGYESTIETENIRLKSFIDQWTALLPYVVIPRTKKEIVK